MKRLWKDQRGQSFAFYAGAILAIMLVVAIVIEVGWWNFKYYRAQQAVDLAALSAAQYVPLSQKEEDYRFGSERSTRKVTTTATTVFQANDGPSGYLEVDIERKDDKIKCCNWVTVKHGDLHSWWLIDEMIDSPRVSDFFQISVKAHGKAEALFKPTEVVPLALIKRGYEDDLTYDRDINITGNLANPSLGTSNVRLGILDVTAHGNMSDSNALSWLTSNYEVGGQGVKSAYEFTEYRTSIPTSEVASALRQRLDNGKKLMILPVVDPTPNARGEVKIIGFACFELRSAGVANNGELSINGKFIKYIDSKSDRRPSSASNHAWYFGVRVVYLDHSVPVLSDNNDPPN